jgi:acyl-CoA thioesterase
LNKDEERVMAKEFPLDERSFNRFGEFIGLRFTGLDEGKSRCVLEADDRLFNPHGVLHGGTIYSMADTGMGAALYYLLDEDELCTTVENKISYFKSVTSGTLVCDTSVINRTKRIAVLESEIIYENRLVAKANGTFYIYNS